MDTVKIEEKQAREWATENTLINLLKQANTTNTILDRYMEQHLTKDQMEKLRADIASGQTIQSRSNDYQRRTADNIEEMKTTDYKTYETMSRMADSIEEKFSGMERMLGGDANSLLGNLGRSFKDIARQNYETMGPSMVSVVTKLGMLAEVMSVLWGRVSNLNTAVMDAYASGVVFTGGMSQMNNAAAASGLGLEKFTSLLNKNSSVAVNLGTQRTLALSKAFMQATRRGVDLGMGMEEAQQTFFDYAENMRVTGRLRDMSEDQIISGTKAYGEQLNSISQITGKRRDQISAEIRDATKKANMQVILNSLDDKHREALQAGIAEFQKAGESAGDLQDMTVGFLSRGVAGMSDAQRQMLSLSGQQGKYQEYVQALMSKDYATSTRLLGEMGEGFRALSGQLSVYADDPNLIGDVARLSATMAMNIQNTSDSVAKFGTMTKPLPEDVQAMQAAINEMNVGLQSLSASFTAIALPIVRVLAPAFEMLAKAVTGLTSLFGVGNTDPASAEAPGGAYGLANLGNVVGSVVVLVGTVFAGSIAAMIMRLLKGGVGAALGATIGKIPGIGKLAMPKPPDLGGAANGVDSVGKAARSFNGIGRGVGGTIRSVMRGIASGFAAFGNPRVLLGIAGLAGIGGSIWIAAKGFQELASVSWEDMAKAGVAITGLGVAAAAAGAIAPAIFLGGVALGAAIGAIGAGLAGAAWLVGETMDGLVNGIKRFDEIDGENLKTVGVGMLGLSAGLAAMGGGSVVNALGGLASSIISFFSGEEDPIDRLKRFGELADPLSKATPALERFSSSFKTAVDTLNNSTFSPSVTDTMEQLKELLGMDESGLFGGSPAVIGQLNDLAAAIGSVAEKTMDLQSASNQRPETLDTSVSDMQKRTLAYYDDQKASNASMIALLQTANQRLEVLNVSITTGNSETVKAIKRGGNVF